MTRTFSKQWIADASPRTKARMAGVFFLLYTATGTWGYFVTQSLVLSRDAAATAANILANETLFRLAIAANLVSAACYLVVTVATPSALRHVYLKRPARQLVPGASLLVRVGKSG